MLAQIDDRLAVRGPGRWRPSTERWCWCWWSSDVLCFFSLHFSFSSSRADIVDSLLFFTAETAENEFRRAGRAYTLIEEGELD